MNDFLRGQIETVAALAKTIAEGKLSLTDSVYDDVTGKITVNEALHNSADYVLTCIKEV